MTEPCFLSHNVGLKEKATCEECYCNPTCRMYANFKKLEEANKALTDSLEDYENSAYERSERE